MGPLRLSNARKGLNKMVEVKTLRPLEILTIRELLSYILSIANDEAQLSKVLYIHLDLLCWIICNGTENKERALNLTVELMGLFAQMLQRHKVTVPLMRRAPKPELCFDAKEFYAMPEELCVTTRIKGFQTNLRKAIAEAPDAHADTQLFGDLAFDALHKCLGRLFLSAGKFPIGAKRIPFGPLRDQKPAAAADQCHPAGNHGRSGNLNRPVWHLLYTR